MASIKNPDIPSLSFGEEAVPCRYIHDSFEEGWTNVTSYGNPASFLGQQDLIEDYVAGLSVYVRDEPTETNQHNVRFNVYAWTKSSGKDEVRLEIDKSDPNYPPTTPEEVQRYREAIGYIGQSALHILESTVNMKLQG